MEKKNNFLKISVLLLLFFNATLGLGFISEAAGSEKPELAGPETEFFQIGYKFHMGGELEMAVHFYRLSINRKPTAKAHTFLGWVLSHQGMYDEAISECLKAIKLDPDFGNPYNDIGVYYIEKKMYDEAIPYLNKAIEAKNYENYEFPHFNLGKVYVIKGQYFKAVEKFKKALEINPKYILARFYFEIFSDYLATKT